MRVDRLVANSVPPTHNETTVFADLSPDPGALASCSGGSCWFTGSSAELQRADWKAKSRLQVGLWPMTPAAG